MTPGSEPLTMTVDGHPAVLRELTVELAGGEVGYYQRGQECFRAAVATAAQVPYEQVPEMYGLHELLPWALEHGVFVDLPPDPLNHRRWLGLGPSYEAPAEYAVAPFARHTVVGSYGAIYFDPAAGWEFAGGLKAPPLALDEIEQYITIERTGPC